MQKISEQELAEINQRLADNFGINTGDGRAIWRIVWADDEMEHRHDTYEDYSPGGLFIRSVTETRYVPKYDKLFPHKYVLEQLLAVPVVSMAELPATKMSYEPMWPFEHASTGEALPPKYDVAAFVIETVNAARGKGSLKKYVEPSTEELEAERLKKVEGLVEEIFGEDPGYTAKYGDTIFVPGPKGVN